MFTAHGLIVGHGPCSRDRCRQASRMMSWFSCVHNCCQHLSLRSSASLLSCFVTQPQLLTGAVPVCTLCKYDFAKWLHALSAARTVDYLSVLVPAYQSAAHQQQPVCVQAAGQTPPVQRLLHNLLRLTTISYKVSLWARGALGRLKLRVVWDTFSRESLQTPKTSTVTVHKDFASRLSYTSVNYIPWIYEPAAEPTTSSRSSSRLPCGSPCSP
jgi:hypothetical protein